MIKNLINLTMYEAWESVNAHRLRSILTMLGIIIGVCAVVLTIAIGEGMRANIQKSIQSLGSNVLMISAAMGGNALGVKGSVESTAIRMGDVEAIRELPDIAAVAPILNSMSQIISSGENWSATILGTTSDIQKVRNYQLEEGEMFEDEVKGAPRVAVLGKTVAEKLFPSGQAVGSTIRLQNMNMQVIGVLKSTGSSMGGQDQDNMVIIPIRTLQQQIFASIIPDMVQQISVSVTSPNKMSEVETSIITLLSDRKKIPLGSDPPFRVQNLGAIAKTASQTGKMLSMFLTATAAISLIVGGIGIMNIMLVSVTERTREIGLRKAIGATQPMILAQFMMESVVLSLSGCFIGISIGFLLSLGIAKIMAMQLSISLFSIILSVTVATLTGVIFGFFPALKAARLEPAEALRIYTTVLYIYLLKIFAKK